MAPIVTEIIHIKINDAFHEKPELHKELREGAAYGGLLHQSYGLGLEDPTQLHWILRTLFHLHFHLATWAKIGLER